MHNRLITATVLLCASCTWGESNPLPDAPSATSRPPAAAAGHPAPVFDRELKIATAAHFFVRAADDAHTCNNLANGGHEYSFPTQSCAGVVALNTAWFAGSGVLSWELARHGHRRIATAVQWIAASVDAADLLVPRAKYRQPTQ